MSSAEAVNRLVVFGDACDSGRLGQRAKQRMREAMYGAFQEAFDAVGVQRGEKYEEDRGDGILVALDPRVPPSAMVGRWLDTLHECLREHNANSAERLRMRVAMHAGPVLNDGRGLVGRAVDLTCRLCDSPVAKRIMAAAARPDLLFIASDWLYTSVVAEGGRYIEPDRYREHRVRLKETDDTAWFHVPRLPAPPDPAPNSAPDPVADPVSDPVSDRPEAAGAPAAAEPSAAGPAHYRNQFTIEGDTQVFQGNVIRTDGGAFIGIRKDSADRSDREDRRIRKGSADRSDREDRRIRADRSSRADRSDRADRSSRTDSDGPMRDE